MLNSVSDRKSLLACLADCPADNHARSLARTVFIRNVIWESKKGLGQSSPIWVIFFFYCLEALKNQQRQ